MTVLPRRSTIATVLACVVTACGQGDGSRRVTGPVDQPAPQNCTIPQSLIFSAAPAKDWIPALTNPGFVGPRDPSVEFLRDSDRIVGLVVDGQAYAVPINVLWWHEIVNVDVGAASLAITHCPLTGSSLVFDREPLGGVEFGVSGLLYLNNLMMYDRSTGESLWPQMLRGARCGVQSGTALRSVPSLEMEWWRWQTIHPDTRVLGDVTGHVRDYTEYPYGDYAEARNANTLFPRVVADDRLQPKELVLGFPDAAEGRNWAIPFSRLEDLGSTAAVHPDEASSHVVVLWDGLGRSAMAFDSRLESGERLRFRVEDGRILDDATDSIWRFDGLALAGALAGTQLTPIAESYAAFWFAWVDFHPETLLWNP
ncbi:MAG: DUF3179 domain-containing protein [Gemmatimonadetes bacterium]|nr:DUF3179 domain-containing protein [Gemmatimonadota bacterium]